VTTGLTVLVSPSGNLRAEYRWGSLHLPFMRVKEVAVHGTSARWHAGCHCSHCRHAHSNTQRTWRLTRARQRLPLEVRQQLLDAIYGGQPFRTALRDLGLTFNQVWGAHQDRSGMVRSAGGRPHSYPPR
jgi:hypothetical protein